MKPTYLSLVFNYLNSLNFQTALLEIMDWEEEKVELYLERLTTLEYSPTIEETLKAFLEAASDIISSTYQRDQLENLLTEMMEQELKEIQESATELEN